MAEAKCKYYKQKKQVSYDNGVTWADVIPYEYQKGELYETESQDCGYVPPVTEYRWVKTNDTTCVETPDPQYRWVNMDASVDYYCEGTTKYYKQKKQVSLDGGQTWSDVVPAEYQKGGVAETGSTDCGYVPPTPTSTKLVANYSDGKVYELECNNQELSRSDVTPSGYYATAMTSVTIGECVTSIGTRCFSNESPNYSFNNLKYVTIPNSVTSISTRGFDNCQSLTRVNSDVDGVCNIPDSVTSIGGEAFYNSYSFTSCTIGSGITSISDYAFKNSNVESITILATTPPALGKEAFDTTIWNGPIYVPASSVDTYKSASTRWSNYAFRIQPIP